jgi:hypothetical protein
MLYLLRVGFKASWLAVNQLILQQQAKFGVVEKLLRGLG